MAAGERRAAPAAGKEEDFEIIDKKQLPDAAELRNEEKAKPEEARWSAPILSLARKASENLALGYGSALKSASLVGLVSKPGSSDSPAKTKRPESSKERKQIKKDLQSQRPRDGEL